MSILTIEKINASKNPTFTLSRFICGNFIFPEKLEWPREMKIAGRILKKFPNSEFWLQFNLGFKLNSLAYFLTGAGKSKLYFEYNKFLLDFKPVSNYIGDEKIGDDKQIKIKKTLKDLL